MTFSVLGDTALKALTKGYQGGGDIILGVTVMWLDTVRTGRGVLRGQALPPPVFDHKPLCRQLSGFHILLRRQLSD